ncbi:MAG: RidA family protein [Dehalococcoidia bacterium]|nr:RidA family protein [Dehalococcoidia bacterium]
MRIEKRMEELGMEMPTARPVRANRVYAMRTGNIVYVSGSTANYPDGRRVMGKVGRDVTVEEAYQGARQAAINLLASLKECIGDLDDVRQIVKLLCMVNTAEDFYDAPSVANGASDVMVELYGERGRHARSAVGIACPAGNSCIEVEMVVEVA